MTPEEKSLLERTYKMAEENNALLRSLRRTARWSLVMRVVYWAVIIGLSFGAFYLIQPYVQSITDLYGQMQGSSTEAQNAVNSIKGFFGN